jgi:hypothetical protein
MKQLIVNKEDYKLEVEITPIKGNQYRLLISRWIGDYAWTHTEIFLQKEELLQLQAALCDIT